MPLHLLKMCVGIDSVARLRTVQAARLAAMEARGERPVLRHWTRHRPRRATEVVDGGSLYWIIRGQIQVRQRIMALERVEDETATKRCAIVLDPDLVETEWRPARPMQGWRYLPATDAPPDHIRITTDDGQTMPPEMARELRALGLL